MKETADREDVILVQATRNLAVPYMASTKLIQVTTFRLKWTPCLGQFCPEFKLVRLLQSQRFGAAPS